MAAGLPSGLGKGQVSQSSAGNWLPPYLLLPSPSCEWLATAIGVMSPFVVAALARATSPQTSTTVDSPAPTCITAAADVARLRIYRTRESATRTVQSDTDGSGKAVARIAITNATAWLHDESNDPTLYERQGDASEGLAQLDLTDTAKGGKGSATKAGFSDTVAELSAEDAVMTQVCFGC